MVFPVPQRDVGGELIGQGLVDIANVYQQQQKKSNLQKIISDPNATPIQKGIAMQEAGMSPELIKESIKGARQNELMQVLFGESGGIGATAQDPRTPSIAPPGVERSPGMQPTDMVEDQPSQQPRQRGVDRLSDDKLRELLIAAPEAKPFIDAELRGREAERKLQQKRESEKRKEFVEERQFATQQVKPYFERIEKIKDSLPLKKRALALSRDAIESDEVGQFSQNRIADMLGIKELKSPKGTQLDIAIKENLISNLSRVSAKGTNLWIEKVMSSAFPQSGQSKSANLTVQEALEAEAAIDSAETEVFDRLAEEDISKFGFVKPDIRRRVNQEVEGLENEIMKRASYRTRDIFEKEKGYKKLENKPVVQGTPLTRGMFRNLVASMGSIEKAFKRARDLGYTVYSNEDVTKYEQ